MNKSKAERSVFIFILVALFTIGTLVYFDVFNSSSSSQSYVKTQGKSQISQLFEEFDKSGIKYTTKLVSNDSTGIETYYTIVDFSKSPTANNLFSNPNSDNNTGNIVTYTYSIIGTLLYNMYETDELADYYQVRFIFKEDKYATIYGDVCSKTTEYKDPIVVWIYSVTNSQMEEAHSQNLNLNSILNSDDILRSGLGKGCGDINGYKLTVFEWD